MILTEDIAHEIHRATGLTVNVRIEEAPVCAGPGYEPPGFHGVGDVVETFHVFVKNHGMDIAKAIGATALTTINSIVIAQFKMRAEARSKAGVTAPRRRSRFSGRTENPLGR